MKKTVDNQLMSRNRQKRTIVICESKGLLIFKGDDIPPAVRVEKIKYRQNGKWSHHTYHLEIADGYDVGDFCQDFGIGLYFPSLNWNAAIERVRSQLSSCNHMSSITDDMIERFIRSEFKQEAINIDADELKFKSESKISDLFASQDFASREMKEASAKLSLAKAEEAEILQAIEKLEEAENNKKLAKETSERNAKAMKLLVNQKIVNLADLKNLMGL